MAAGTGTCARSAEPSGRSPPEYRDSFKNRRTIGAKLAAMKRGSSSKQPAKDRGWKPVRARFPERDNMPSGLLDLQRASWAPMLGLDERSVALDIRRSLETKTLVNPAR